MDINVVCLLENVFLSCRTLDRMPSLPGISLIPVINVSFSEKDGAVAVGRGLA
jgi:hypothetical protein